MSKEYDTVIAGGGLAGLTSAAFLSRSGFRTLLLEKGSKTGGLVNTFWHQGFAFDGGIRAFEDSGILFPMLKNLGIHMEFLKNPVSIGIADLWTRLTGPESLKDYCSMLEGSFPAQGEEIGKIESEIRKVMGHMEVLYGIENPLFLENLRNPSYLLKTLLPWLIKYQIHIRKATRLDQPIMSYLQRFTCNQALIDLITQHFFQDTPAFFALSYFTLYQDYRYPKGGTGVLAQKMTDTILASGGEIRTETAVLGIDPDNHSIAASSGETVRYRKLIWAADQKTLYAALPGKLPAEAQQQRILAERSKGNDSILTLFLGTRMTKGDVQKICGAHAFYTPTKEGLSSLPAWEEEARLGSHALLDWVRAYLSRTTYEISCPVLRDEALAPQGKTGLIISTLMDYGLVRHFAEEDSYAAFKKCCIQQIIHVLGSSLFHDLQDHTEFALCATPLTIERETGNAQGAITGWSFTNEIMPAESRFQKISASIATPIQDIYQCGQWTFSPSGLPVSILTGKLAADAVSKALN